MHRYKRVLDNQGEKKSGRGTKKWEFFDQIHDFCGDKASSVSLRELPNSKSVSATTAASTKAPVKKIAIDLSVPVPSSSKSGNVSVIEPSSETDEDDVVAFESVSLKRKANAYPRESKKRSKNDTPQWFVDWQNELRTRMDKQESLQSERTTVLRQTNDLLKQLITQTRNEP